MPNPTEAFPPLPGVQIETRKDGIFIAKYLNRVIRSNNKLRLMAYLQRIAYEEQGMAAAEAEDQSWSAYMPPKNSTIQVQWLQDETAPKSNTAP